MKREVILTTILLVIGIPGAIRANFPGFLMGDQPDFQNFIVSVAYFMLWLVVLGIAFKTKNRGIAKVSLIFWIIMLISSLIMLFFTINIHYDGGIILLLNAFLLWTEWYGIGFISNNNLGIVLCLSLIMFIISISVYAFYYCNKICKLK